MDDTMVAAAPAAGRAAARRWRDTLRALPARPYLLLLPSLVFLVLFTYFPIVEVVGASFFRTE